MKLKKKQLLILSLMNFTALYAHQDPFFDTSGSISRATYPYAHFATFPNFLPSDFNKEVSLTAPTHSSSTPLKIKARNWGKKYAKISQVFKKVTDDRTELNDLRSHHIRQFQRAYETGSVDTQAITHQITKDTIAYLNHRVEQEIAKLGPTPCKFSIFTMGSMARQETGFITDLEIGFLVEKNNFSSQKYFSHLAQRLSDRLFLLGEHPSVGGKGLRIDEADNAPLHMKFFARYADPSWAKTLMNDALVKRNREAMPFEGSRPYIATPEEFSAYFHPNFLKKHIFYDRAAYKSFRDTLIDKNYKLERKRLQNKMKSNSELYEEVRHWVEASIKPFSPREQNVAKSVANLGRNIAYVFGDRGIYKKFMKGRERILSEPSKNKHFHYKTRRQEIAFTKMIDENVKYLQDPNNFIMTGKIGESIDLKRQLYRYCEQVFTTLGFYYNLGTQNTTEITKRLVERHIMTPQFGEETLDLLNFVSVLRLKEQSILRKQGWDIYLDNDKFMKDKLELEQSIAGLQNARSFLKSTEMSQGDIKSFDAKIREKKHELDELLHVAPGKILSKEEQSLLEQKYIPLIQRLYMAMTQWLKGN